MEISYRPEQSVRLNVLGAAPQTIPAQLRILVGRRAELRSESAVTPGTAVRIDLEDSMLLGEVAGCGSEGSLFVTQVEVVEAIPSLSDLARLVSAVMNEGRVEVSDRNFARVASAR
jgi:hypothetical protein